MDIKYLNFCYNVKAWVVKLTQKFLSALERIGPHFAGSSAILPTITPLKMERGFFVLVGCSSEQRSSEKAYCWGKGRVVYISLILSNQAQNNAQIKGLFLAKIFRRIA